MTETTTSIRAGIPARLSAWIGWRQRELSARVHAAGDARARRHGWTVTESTGRFGFGARSYRDPRFDHRRRQLSPGASRSRTPSEAAPAAVTSATGPNQLAALSTGDPRMLTARPLTARSDQKRACWPDEVQGDACRLPGSIRDALGEFPARCNACSTDRAEGVLLDAVHVPVPGTQDTRAERYCHDIVACHDRRRKATRATGPDG